MAFQSVNIEQFKEGIFPMFSKEWFLLTAGTMEDCNTMTAAWGGFGELWGKEVASVYVRRSRYTYDFMDREDYFTMSFFGYDQREAMGICGSKSGRDMDKIAASGLHKIELDHGIAFEEAKTIVVCKKLFATELGPKDFLDDSIMNCYRGQDEGDYHTLFIGEVKAIYEK